MRYDFLLFFAHIKGGTLGIYGTIRPLIYIVYSASREDTRMHKRLAVLVLYFYVKEKDSFFQLILKLKNSMKNRNIFCWE